MEIPESVAVADKKVLDRVDVKSSVDGVPAGLGEETLNSPPLVALMEALMHPGRPEGTDIGQRVRGSFAGCGTGLDTMQKRTSSSAVAELHTCVLRLPHKWLAKQSASGPPAQGQRTRGSSHDQARFEL